MKFKKIMFVSILLLAIFAIGAVSASDVNDTAIASEDTNQIELSSNNEMVGDNLQTSEENSILTQIDNNESVSVETNSEILSEDIGNYSGLADEISQGGNVELKHKYYKYDDYGYIEITEGNRVIDGKGAIIDMAGSTYSHAFYVSASDVIIKNLTIKNVNEFCAVYFVRNGEVTNCNFTNNHASYGGAIQFASTGTVSYCNFTNNSAYYGGAVYFEGTGNVSNCNFVNNTAESNGGAIWMSTGTVLYCNFTNNSAYYGGAVYFDKSSTGNVSNCNFIDNKANGDSGCWGGAVYMYLGCVENCNFTNNSARYGGAVYFLRNGEVTNCNFIDNEAIGDSEYCGYGGAVYFLRNGEVTNCNFTDNQATGYGSKGGAVYFASTGNVVSCNFIDNEVNGFLSNAGAIYFYGAGTVLNCNFTNNSAYSGGAIYSRSKCDISFSIFLVNKKDTCSGSVMVFDNCVCWFGNNASNYETEIEFTYLTSWLFLDATISPVDGVEGKSSIVFNFKLYDSTSKLITTDIPNLPDIVFDLSATNGYLSKYSARLGEPVIFTPVIDKEGSIKASYNGVSYSVIIDNLNLEASNVSKYYNGSERFIVTLSDSAHKPVSNKNVSITIDGKTTVGVTDEAGQFSIPLDLNPGNYMVTSSYNGLNVISNVNIYSTVEFDNIKEGIYKDATFNATILDSAGKPMPGREVKIKVGNVNLTAVSDSNGVVRVSPDLDAGSYVMTITNPVTGEVKSSDVVISKASSTVSISSATFAHGVTLTANILPGNISGEVVFTINGNQDYSEDVVNSKSSITLRNMDSGKYTAVVTFKGNANYNASTSSQITIDVDEYDYVISAPDVTKDYGGPEKFNITLTKNNAPIANANVKITLNDVDYTKTTDKNGKISMDISNLDAGVYGIVVKYNSITANSVIIVNQLPTTTDLSFVKHSSDNVTLTAKITPSAVGEVVFTVNGKDYKVNITAGKAILDLSGLDDGNYSAKAVYKGATNYKSSTSNTVSFIVDKGSIFIYAPDVTKEYGGPEKFNITLTKYNIPVAGANVKITINGVEYNETTDSEGKISIDISDLNVGVYDAVVKYDSVSVKSVITVNLVSTKITWSASKITTVYNGNKYLVATLIDSNKKPMVGVKVTIKLSNGKTQTSKTNAKGQVKLSANGLAPVKTYTATATFAGNATYKKSTATAKITVKKATPKLTAKAKSFKRTVKTKKYVVTLKTNQNKVMKNTKVTLKVNGKTYSATTNAKGQATFKITKLTKKGKYTAVVKFAGNKYYNAKTVKPKITVK